MNQNKHPIPNGDEFSLDSILAEFSSGTSGRETPSPKPVAAVSAVPKNESGAAESAAKISKEPTTVVNLPKLTEIPAAVKPAAAPTAPKPRPLRAEVKAEDLAMPDMESNDAEVIDIGAFDTVYEKKQRRIKRLKQQIIAEDKQARKEQARAKRKNLRPSHIKTGPIPLTPAAKAEMEQEKKQGFVRLAPRPKKDAEKAAEEKAKPLLNPLHMLKKFEKTKQSLAVRFWLALAFCCGLFYIAAASYLHLPLPANVLLSENVRMHAIVSGAMLAATALCGYDIVARGIAGLVLLKINGETLVTASAAVSLAHCISLFLRPDRVCDGSGLPVYGPIAIVPAVAIVFFLWSGSLRAKLNFRSLRNCYRLKQAKTLTTLPEKFDGDAMYALTKMSNQQNFYRSLTENDTAATVMRWFAPLALLASLFLSVYCGYSGPEAAPFLWCWSLILCLTPALGLAVASILPLTRAAKRLYRDGILLGGGKAVAKMGARSFVLLTDEDLFPGEAITINGYKLLDPEKKELALSAAASLLDAANTSLAKPFLRIATDSFAPIRPVRDLVFSDAGGITGTIDGHHVMVGTASFVQRAWIKIPPDIKLRTAVFCVVDSELLAIFAVKYQVTPKADYALNLLEDNGYMPVVATRDFNVTASFIQSRFGISSADVVYPPADMRVALSDPTVELESSGLIVTYGGSDAVADALISCRRYRTATRLSVSFSLVSAVIGLALCTLMSFFGWAEVATPVNLFIYYLLWAVPPFIFAGWVRRF